MYSALLKESITCIYLLVFFSLSNMATFQEQSFGIAYVKEEGDWNLGNKFQCYLITC